MAWVDMSVRAPDVINSSSAIKKIDEELTKVAAACFHCPPPNSIPVQNQDGTWGLRVMDARQLDFVKGILRQHNLEVVTEEQRG